MDPNFGLCVFYLQIFGVAGGLLHISGLTWDPDMQFIGVIPARYGSTRFPGKPLKLILGKPLLQWVIEGSKTARSLKSVIVATDHPEIAALAENCGAQAVMTDPNLPSGSDRVWAAAQNERCDGILNIQGDEPLINGHALDALSDALASNPDVHMVTLGKKLKQDDLINPSVAKIVVNHRGEALYFSRLGIPFSRKSFEAANYCFRHIGIYGYRKDFLREYCKTGRVGLEAAEDLEQLRALHLGARVKVVVVDHEAIGVDTPQDIAIAEKLLRARAQDK